MSKELTAKHLLQEVQQLKAQVSNKSAGNDKFFSATGELAALLLSYFCDGFGFNYMEMSKFITQAHAKIKKDISWASFKNDTGDRVPVPLGGMLPTKAGIELCLKNMSAANMGIIIDDSGRKPILLGTDC